MTHSISLIVRCYNEEAHIGRLLTGVARQTTPPDEVIVVDSGSTDATLAIASAFDVKVVHLEPELFSFGTALNRGIDAAQGDIAVFASAHVYPIFDTWLELLTIPFVDPSIALSYGRQVVPPGGSFSEGRLLAQWFPAGSIQRQAHPFCNNANAAIRRELWQEQRFDEQLTGLEDLDWARKALQRGYLLSYCADAPIVHVHSESFSQLINRYRREAIAHKQIDDAQDMTLLAAIRLAAANIGGDVVQASREGVLRNEARGIVRFRLAQFYGAYRGFGQQGPVSELLRRRFYYPAEQNESAPGEQPAVVGSPINYDEPLPPREEQSLPASS